MKRILGFAAAAALSALATAQTPFVESEANDTFATADFVSSALYPFGGVAVDGAVSTSDVDYFSFDLTAGDRVGLSIFDFTADDDDNDSLLGIFAPDGTLFDSDDDDGIGLLSMYQFEVPTTGRWAFAVSGFGDDDFNGLGHDENYDYKLGFVINPIPEPGSLALLAAGLLALSRRR